ncbi:hypothetical protein B0J11DRAFT_250629 [Dendryphion nanum]|uniref:Uncharacterized protein n=1 Tax=Dendryphion nanum TaxID=256645 RepID=A0A9P9E4C3_9PLEO|nr:hypothetical protein B0J11DRAFT_250629 [Dendryphion nanum]
MKSPTHAASQQSPFNIPREDIETVCASPGFQVLRRHLATQADFCTTHTDDPTDLKETWLLHRDILHALIMPVVAMFKRASALAGAALCTDRSEDLELAFAGDARGAFLWLQCFMGDEEEWAGTRGCPACITLDSLSTESHIRLTIAASLLSTSPISTSRSSTPSSSPTTSPPQSAASTPTSESVPAVPNIQETEQEEDAQEAPLTLPSLPHILPALRTALDADPFWGPDYFPYILSRSTLLCAGIQALITECVDLEALVSSPTSSSIPSRKQQNGEGQGMRIRSSKLAKRQLRMRAEELELLRRCAMQCWARAVVPSRVRNEILGLKVPGERRRSLTCP